MFEWSDYHFAVWCTCVTILQQASEQAEYLIENYLTECTQIIIIGALFPSIHVKYMRLQNISAAFMFGPDLPIRPMFPSPLQMLISFWILGKARVVCAKRS